MGWIHDLLCTVAVVGPGSAQEPGLATSDHGLALSERVNEILMLWIDTIWKCLILVTKCGRLTDRRG